MDIKSIIDKKRKQKELSKDEIVYFIGKYTKGEISESQAAALLSYIYINGLTVDEIAYLAQEIGKSGDVLDLDDISENIIDEHSTGGVGDKISLILIPIMASLGVPMAKISSRGLGITGGIIDKLESIPGFDTEINIDEFKNNINIAGASIINQSFNIAPVETKLYKLRNDINCRDSVPIITACLLGTKIATGSKKIVFEIVCGKGTYIKSRSEAQRLAKLLVRIGKKVGREVACVVTAMEEPIGYAVGNTLEIKETIDCLKGKMPKDIEEVVLSIGSLMLKLAGKGDDLKVNSESIKKVIDSGEAFEKFEEIVKNQYGSLEYLNKEDKFKEAQHIVPVHSLSSGVVNAIDADIVGSIARYLGAGRVKEGEEADKTSGIYLCKKIGDTVNEGDVVAYIHSNDESKIEGATKNLAEAFQTTTKKLKEKPRVIEILK